jgi:hypothetical protein
LFQDPVDGNKIVLEDRFEDVNDFSIGYHWCANHEKEATHWVILSTFWW